ncbi:MAG: hypothetical protein KBC23_04125 [Candidatus Omnitrophica bacterium]|nr:hypothetical protein [Candidatus Omnitrophota bacterium]
MEIPTFTRPWIVPGEIIIRESPDGAYIYKAGLQVMLEQDYLKDSPFFSITDPKQKEMNAYSSELLRAEILPKLTREVNSAKRYAALRQVYYSLVLAQWFKQKAQGQANPFSQAIDTKDLSGLTALTPWDKNTYYNAYKKSFSEGEYKKEEQVPTASGLVIRTYFSGGVQMDGGSLRFAIPSGAGIAEFFAQVDSTSKIDREVPLENKISGVDALRLGYRILPSGNPKQTYSSSDPIKPEEMELYRELLRMRQELVSTISAKDGGTTVEASLTATVLLTAGIVGVSFGLLFLRYGGRIPHSVVAKWMLSMFALMPILYSSFAFNVFDATILSNPAFSYLNIGSHGNVVPAPNVVELILNNKDGGDFEVTVADMEALLDPGSAASESLAKFMASDRVHFPKGIPYSLIQRVVEKCAAQSRIDQFWNQPADETRVHGLLVNFIKSHQRLFIEARNAREAEAAKDGGTLEEYIKISDQLLNAQDDGARAKAAQSLGLEGVAQVLGSHYALQKKSRLAWFAIQIAEKSLSRKEDASYGEELSKTINRMLDEIEVANGRTPEKITGEFDSIVLDLLGKYAKSSQDRIAVQSLHLMSIRPELSLALRKQARQFFEDCKKTKLLPPAGIRGHHLQLALKYLSERIGGRFDGHGIAKDSYFEQIASLENFLKNGPDPDRVLYTCLLKSSGGVYLGASDTPLSNGLFIILSDIDGSIGKYPITDGPKGIRYVLINDMGYKSGERDEQKIKIIEEVERLKRTYPQVEFIQANQAIERLNAIVTQYDDAAGKRDGGITSISDYVAAFRKFADGLTQQDTEYLMENVRSTVLFLHSRGETPTAADASISILEYSNIGKVRPDRAIVSDINGFNKDVAQRMHDNQNAKNAANTFFNKDAAAAETHAAMQAIVAEVAHAMEIELTQRHNAALKDGGNSSTYEATYYGIQQYYKDKCRASGSVYTTRFEVSLEQFLKETGFAQDEAAWALARFAHGEQYSGLLVGFETTTGQLTFMYIGSGRQDPITLRMREVNWIPELRQKIENYKLEAASKDGGRAHGGIDFRTLPLSAQTGVNPAVMQPAIDMKALQVLGQQSKMQDLNKEWARIEKQIAGKAMPYEKIKEYLAVCSDREAAGDQLSRVEQCLSNILKLEEACAVSTSDQMKELLLIVETVRT